MREWSVAVAAALSLVASCLIRSTGKWLWYDEIMTWYLVTDPSWGHMLRTIAQGGDSAPPLYHVLARVWIGIVGATPLALRMFSALGLSTALLVTFAGLRRAFPWRAAVLGTLVVFGTSEYLLVQTAEIRFYGVLTTLVACGAWLTHRLVVADAVSRRLLAANVATHAALVLTHPYGGLYSAALLGANVLCDLGRGRPWPRRWLTYPAGWLALAAWLAFAARSQLATSPRSWIPVPGTGALLSSYTFTMDLNVVAFVLTAALILAAAGRPRPTDVEAAEVAATEADDPDRIVARDAWLVIASGLLAVPIMAFVVSRVVISILYPRYLIPATLGVGMLIAYGITAVMEAPRRGTDVPSSARSAWSLTFVRRLAAVGVPLGWAVILSMLLALPVAWARRTPRPERPDLAIERISIDGVSAATLPVVLENGFDFLEMSHNTPRARPLYTFLLDSAQAFGPGSAPFETIGYSVFDLYRRARYSRGRIEPWVPFVCGTPRFIVVDDSTMGWFEHRIASDRAWTSSVVGVARGRRVRLVQRVPGAAPVECGGAGGTTPVATPARANAPTVH